MPVEPDELRAAMRRWATGVTVVTASSGGSLWGMTVNSFASVSLVPPQVLVCIERGTRTHQAIAQSGAFAISVLNENQQERAARFAGQVSEMDERFADVAPRTLVTGSPILDGAIAFLDCKVVGAYQAGTHTIFVGLVEASGAGDEGSRPLLYYSRAYRRLADSS